MSTILVESFDMYASTSEALTTSGGPWTSGIGSNQLVSGSLTQFNSGQALNLLSGNACPATFTSATNETTVYGSVRFNKTSVGTSSQYTYLTFTDAGTAQCTIRLNWDGSIGLYSGSATGTLIQTYSAQFNPTIWNSAQFKVVINNSTGSIEIRLNGSTTNAITQTGVNTRAGTANSYVNGFSFGPSAGGGTFYMDDLYLNNTSGNNPVSWPGDVRAVQQVPSGVTASNFSSVQTNYTLAGSTAATFFTLNNAYYLRFAPPCSGVVNSLSFLMNANLTGNVKFAIYDSTGITAGQMAPGSIIATSNAVSNPTTSTNTATFSSPPTLIGGTFYFIGVDQDATANYKVANVTGFGYTASALSYASFPTANPTGMTSVTSMNFIGLTFNLASNNYTSISDTIEDGDTTYIYASSVKEDTYTLSAIPTSYSVAAVQYYVMWKRSDAGSRTAQLSVNANSSGDTAEITNSSLPTTYQYQFVTLEKDPAGSYWTATTANSQVLGIAVTV